MSYHQVGQTLVVLLQLTQFRWKLLFFVPFSRATDMLSREMNLGFHMHKELKIHSEAA
jgi:hypothetical protein